MEDNATTSLLEGKVVGIRFSMATRREIVSIMYFFTFFVLNYMSITICKL